MACNLLHAVEHRLCRWILFTHDRVGADTLYLTQQFLAAVLAVPRASVSIVAGTLQQGTFIAVRPLLSVTLCAG
jgi:hypothetical protein